MHDRVTHEGIDVRAVVLVAVAILAAVGFALLIAYWMWSNLRLPQGDGGPNARFDFKVAAPRLESAPQLDRANYSAEKERLLHSWQWADKQAGIARIPIETAMQLMAQNSANTPSDSSGKRK